MQAKESWFGTVLGFALATLCGTAIVGVTFYICKIHFDPHQDHAFGLSPEIAELAMAAYAPAVAATLTGFVGVLLRFAGTGQEVPNIKLSRPWILYLLAGSGLGLAELSILMISKGMLINDAKSLATVSAAVWAGTLGLIFDRYFRQFASIPTTLQTVADTTTDNNVTPLSTQ